MLGLAEGGLGAKREVPTVDIFPGFILTWAIWHYLKGQDEKERFERLKEKWK